MNLLMKYFILYVLDSKWVIYFYWDILGLLICVEYGMYVEFEIGFMILVFNM